MNTENQTEQTSIGIGRDVKDGVVVAGKDNTINVNITQLPPEKPQDKAESEKSSFLIPNYIIVLALIGLSVWWFMQSTTLKPFEGNTYGIIVTTFKGNTEEQKNKGKEIQSAIQSTLNARFKELGINDAEARKDSTLLESHEAAREFGKKYKAELVIWGDVTIQGIIPNITIVNEESEASEIMNPDTSILKDSLCHTALAQVNDIRFSALTDEPTRLVSFVVALKYYKLKKYDKAIEYFTYSIPDKSTKNIDSSRIFEYRGYTWNYMNEYDKAIIVYTQSISINPKNDRAYRSRGNVYWVKGEYDKAIADLIHAIHINPRNTWAYNDFAWLSATCPDEQYRNGEKAVESAQKATELEPNSAAMWDTLSAAYAETGKFEEAIKTQEKAIEILTEKERKEELSEYTEHLNSYKAQKPWREKKESK